MITRSKALTIPIPVHKLLKVVAIVDRHVYTHVVQE